MTKLGGWSGKILKINLTDEKTSEIDSFKYAEKYMGGVGIGARIFWEECVEPMPDRKLDEPWTPVEDPLTPENPLIFMTGPLTGTIAPATGRMELVGVSPFTHPVPNFTYSGCGGDFPAELKYAGFDGLVVKGKADEPKYIFIDNEDVQIRDASGYVGADTYSTQKHIMRELEDRKVRTICIGPAGENLVRFACIISDTGSAFGQGGFGAVMGSKNLKAISVRGSKSIPIMKPKKLMKLSKIQADNLTGLASPKPALGLNSGPFLSRKYGIRPDACHGCPMACRVYLSVPGQTSGQGMCVSFFYGIARNPPAGDGFAADKATWLAKEKADLYGINVVELAGQLWFLYSCFKKGIISEEELRLPKWPKSEKEFGGTHHHKEFLETWINKITYREGIGDILAEGTARAAEELDAWDIYEKYYFARGYHTHWANSVVGCLAWAMDSRDPFNSGHNYLYGVPESSEMWAAFGVPEAAQMAWGSEANPKEYNHVPKTLSIIQNRKYYKDSLPLCDWVYPNIVSPEGLGDLELVPRMLNAVTGINLNEKELQKVGERVYNLHRSIMVVEGRTKREDTVYEQKFKERFYYDGMGRMVETFGPLDKNRWGKIKEEFYKIRGWDVNTGKPKESTLRELGLKEEANELKRRELLP